VGCPDTAGFQDIQVIQQPIQVTADILDQVDTQGIPQPPQVLPGILDSVDHFLESPVTQDSQVKADTQGSVEADVLGSLDSAEDQDIPGFAGCPAILDFADVLGSQDSVRTLGLQEEADIRDSAVQGEAAIQGFQD
jgi:hypothetical protein